LDPVIFNECKEKMHPVKKAFKALDRSDLSLSEKEQIKQTRTCLLEIGDQIQTCLEGITDPAEAKRAKTNLWYFVSKFTEYDPTKLYKLYKKASKRSDKKEGKSSKHDKDKNDKEKSTSSKTDKESKSKERHKDKEKDKGDKDSSSHRNHHIKSSDRDKSSTDRQVNHSSKSFDRDSRFNDSREHRDRDRNSRDWDRLSSVTTSGDRNERLPVNAAGGDDSRSRDYDRIPSAPGSTIDPRGDRDPRDRERISGGGDPRRDRVGGANERGDYDRVPGDPRDRSGWNNRYHFDRGPNDRSWSDRGPRGRPWNTQNNPNQTKNR